MKMKLLFFPLCILLWFGLGGAYGQEKEVTLANIEYPPFAGEKLKNFGFLSEIQTEAFKKEGYTVVYKWVPWARGLKGVEQGTYDGLCVAWHRPEREKLFIFSAPLPASEIVFYKRRGTEIAFNGDYTALKPYRIGIVRGYANPPEFDAARHLLNTEEVAEDATNVKKLIKGRLDLILIDRYLARYIISTEMIGFSEAIEPIEPMLKEDINYIMFSRAVEGIQEKVEAFDRGLKALHQEGKVNEILKKHGF